MDLDKDLEETKDSTQPDVEQFDEIADAGTVVSSGVHDKGANTTDKIDVEEEYEEVELEILDSDIICYLVDEDDKEIGFSMLDEDGNEVEYYYVDEENDESNEAPIISSQNSSDDDDNPFNFGISKESVAETTGDINAIYKDGIEVAAELKGAFDDIKSALDFKNILKK